MLMHKFSQPSHADFKLCCQDNNSSQTSEALVGVKPHLK